MSAHSPQRAGERRLTRAFFGLLAIVYFGVFPYLQEVNNPNENSRTYLVLALVDHHTFRLDEVARRYGWTNDLARVPEPGGGTHLAAVKGPWMSLIGAPVYAAERAVLAAVGKRPPTATAGQAAHQRWLRTTTIVLQLFCAHLPGYLFLVWLERRMRAWSSDATLRLATVAAVGLGTNFLAYSLLFVSHAWSATAAFVALELVRDAAGRRAPSAREAFVAGCWVSLSALLEYQGVFVALPLGLWAGWVFRRRLGALALAVATSALPLLWVQWASFGHPLATGHRHMQTEAFAGLWREGVLGFTGLDREALGGLLFDRGYGFFGTSPFFWTLALLPLALWLGVERRARDAALVGVATALVVTLAMASSRMWRGGWTIGPRYLGALPGLLAPAALVALDALATRGLATVARGLAVGLAAASFLQIGALSLLVTTLPESIVRPVPQIVAPLLALGLAPHHAGELVGAGGVEPFKLALAAPLGCLALALFAAGREHATARAALAVVVAALALRPALTLPAGARDDGPAVRGYFYTVWEPKGRDRLSAAWARAAEGPCAHREIGRYLQVIGRAREAEAHARLGAACGR
ncbi:MAG: hypothetical protein IT374_09055 [Polyangiaceae bacterium]|nr:hypothetical protein [Polyangiaceae bacterium]